MKLKKLIIIMFLFITVLSINIYSSNDKYILHSDVKTYLNELPIKAYNFNSKMVIVAEDLKNYGYNVKWNADERTLVISGMTYDRESLPMPYTHEDNISKDKIGTVAHEVLPTDIKTYYGDKLLESFNINGRTVVYIEEFAEKTGYIKSKWNETDRTLYVSCAVFIPYEQWSYAFRPDESIEFIADDSGFTLEFANITDGNEVNFELINHTGSYKPLEITLSAHTISFDGILNGEEETSNPLLDILYLFHNINIRHFERIEKDTPERREKLSEYLKIYINDELITGEISYQQGNNSYYSNYIFDKPYSIDEIETIKIKFINLPQT